jgi:hypothetical protein
MNNLYQPADVAALIRRIEQLRQDAPRQWGKMKVAQMLAHCNVSMETAMGQNQIKRLFIGRILGTLLRPVVLGRKPFARNTPTDKSYIFKDDRVFEEEKAKLIAAVRKFAEGGPAQCTTHPHPFFGSFTPEQWAVFQWKHLDHHLRQFGA